MPYENLIDSELFSDFWIVEKVLDLDTNFKKKND